MCNYVVLTARVKVQRFDVMAIEAALAGPHGD
jgi:hypothetical protein